MHINNRAKDLSAKKAQRRSFAILENTQAIAYKSDIQDRYAFKFKCTLIVYRCSVSSIEQ